jgi:hypothetical protein
MQPLEYQIAHRLNRVGVRPEKVYASRRQPGVWQMEAPGRAMDVMSRMKRDSLFAIEDGTEDFTPAGYVAIVRFRLADPPQHDAAFCDPFDNGVESELAKLARQYAELCADYADVCDHRDKLLQTGARVHELLNAVGIPQGDLIERVQVLIDRIAAPQLVSAGQVVNEGGEK